MPPQALDLGPGGTSGFTASEAVAAITRITSGNFRLTCRLTCRLAAQIQRVLEINNLSVVTREVARGRPRIARHRGHVMCSAAAAKPPPGRAPGGPAR